MKRKGAVPDGEQDKKKSAVYAGIAARTRSAANNAAALAEFIPETFKLTDFPNEVLTHFYSFLNFKDRQVTRRVCRRLLKFVDQSTQGADKLVIKVVPAPVVYLGGMRFVIWMQPDHDGPESSANVEVVLHIVRGRHFTEASLPKLLSSLPLSSIRPKILSLTIGPGVAAPRQFFAGLTEHMTEQQVPRSVREFDLFYSAPYEPNPEVQQAFLAFERSSRIQKLILRDSVNFFLPTAAQFTQLESLILYPRHDEQEAALDDLASLSAHPTLRELLIYSHITFINLLTDLTSFKNIQKLTFYCNCNLLSILGDGEDDPVFDEEFFNAFVNMIHGMDNLECLETLHFPSVQFWQRLMRNNVTSSRLQELKILYNEDYTTGEDLEKVVQGLQTFAPCLTTLCLRIERGTDWHWDEHTILALSELRQHPSLSKLELAKEADIGQEVLSNLRQGLGNRVKFSRVPFESSFY